MAIGCQADNKIPRSDIHVNNVFFGSCAVLVQLFGWQGREQSGWHGPESISARSERRQ